MSKKTAVSMAAASVTALMFAMVVATANLGTLRSSSAQLANRRQKPIIKTQTRTVTVHRKDGGGGAGAPVTIIRQGSPSGDDGEDRKEECKPEGDEHEDKCKPEGDDHHEGDDEHKGDDDHEEEPAPEPNPTASPTEAAA